MIKCNREHSQKDIAVANLECYVSSYRSCGLKHEYIESIMNNIEVLIKELKK